MGSGSGKRRRGARGLTRDERQLWERIAATAAPMHPIRPAPGGPEDEPARPPQSGLKVQTAKPSAPAGFRTTRPTPPTERPKAAAWWLPPEAGQVGRPEPGLDRRTAERLRKGARDPDARIDLHGMTADRAHQACLRFLAGALSKGHRVVLVITGKGQKTPSAPFGTTSRGVIRESLPGWLRASGLGSSIVGIYEAHQRHGGAGAFYIYLKKRR